MKPRLYIETTVVSYLTARPSRDLLQAARQQITTDWWTSRRPAFDGYVSQIVIDECAEGDPQAAARRLNAIEAFPLLAINEDATVLAETMIARQLVPTIAADDALHIAVAAVHGVRYLLTWNFKHIANAEKAEAIRAECLQAGFVCPVICTPEELMEET